MSLNKNLIFITVALLFSCAVWLGSQGTQQGLTNRILQSGTYTTNPNRLPAMTDSCTGRSRNSMVSAEAQAQADAYKADVGAVFTRDGNQLIRGLLNGTVNPESLKDDPGPFIRFIGPFIVGLIIIVLIWPFLCCCCVCPSCCPSKCCQKKQDEQYTKCELMWPSVVLCVALLLAIAASIVGFTRASALSNGMGNTVCSTFILMDDFLNGNATTDNSSFFIGLSTLVGQLTVLNNTIDDINSNLTDLGSGGAFMTALRSNLSQALSDTSKIPNGIANGTLTLSYATPINSAAPGGTLASAFIVELGYEQNSTSLVGGTYSILKGIDDFLVNNISANVDNFAGSIAGFKSSLGGAQSTINDFSNTLNSVSTTATQINEQAKAGIQGLRIGVPVFFGLIIGLSVLGIIGMMLMTFCQKWKCRYLIYFACVLLFALGIIGFLITTLFSVFVPVIYWGCEFITFSLVSPSNFQQNFGTIIDANTSSYITVCFPSQNGDIISKVAPDLATTLGSLNGAIGNLNTFPSGTFNQSLSGNNSIVATRISQTLNTQTPDLNVAQITILDRISNKNNYPGCLDSKFVADSWVPSTSQVTEYVSCKISGGAATTSCPTITSASCVGCMDTTRILTSNTTQAQVTGAMSSRYTGAGDCGVFGNEIGYTWQNYYQVKKTQINSVQTRYNTANSRINTVFTDITVTIPNKFQTVINILSTTAQTITDPRYGLVAGLNCRVIGQDIVRITSVFCLQSFNNFYFLRLVIGIASFGILFAMCCSVCAGVRHYKHSERVDKLPSPDFNQSISNIGNQQTNAQFNMKY